MKLERQILFGFAGGIILGVLSRLDGAAWLQRAVVALEPLGTIFIRLITMVVVPLVIGSVFAGVGSLGSARTLGRVGGKTLGYFLGTTLIAAIVGLAAAVLSDVGGGLSAATRATLDAGSASLPAGTAPGVVQTILGLVPQNPIAAAASGDLLPLLVAVCIFAAAATVVDTEGRRVVVRFFEGINDLSLLVITWLMRLAPAAVFVLIAVTVARSGLGLLGRLATYASVVVIALAAHVVIALLPLLRWGANVPVGRFVQSVGDALLLAFSTASSSATLPVSMAAARERLGIPNEIVGFVLPAGASLNKNGSAAYKAVTAVFLAQVYGMSVSGGTMLTIVLTATAAAFAGTGVPGSSLVTTVIVLNAIGLGPRAAAGIALVAAIDRPLDMCRSFVNTFSNLVGAAWIARSEARVG